MKVYLNILVFLISVLTFSQTNLLDSSSWSEGTGTVGNFYPQGSSGENIREIGTDPYGEESVIWKAIPDN